jgi:hypothetical protein
MKEIMIFAMTVIFSMVSASACDASKGMRPLESPVLNLQTPVGWRAEYQGQNRSILVLSPDEACGFTISWRNQTGPVDLETQFSAYFGQWQQRQPSLELGPGAASTKIGGYPALRRKAFSRSGDMVADVIVFAAGDRRFGIKMLGDPAGYAAVARLFEAMLESIRLPALAQGTPVTSAPSEVLTTQTAPLIEFRDANISFEYPNYLAKQGCGRQTGKQSSRFTSCVQLLNPRTSEVIEVRYGVFVPGRDMIADIAGGLPWDYILATSSGGIGFEKVYNDPSMTPDSCPLGNLQHRLYGGGAYQQHIGEHVLGTTVAVGGRVVNLLDAWDDARGRSPEIRLRILSSLRLR